MILEFMYKCKDIIFTLIEMMFLMLLLKSPEHNIKIREYKKKALQIFSIAVL